MYIPGWGEFVGLIEWLLVQLATFTGNSGLAIILLTIIIKLAMVPLTLASLRSAKRMQELQPLIRELQKKYADDRQMLSAETMKLYQEHRVNPFGSCLPLVFQMPIFIGLYYAILNISTQPPSGFTTNFLWIRSIAEPDPLFILVVVVTVTQFIQQRMTMPQKVPGQTLDPQQQMMNQMMMIMPLMVGFFAWNFASGAVIYWITQNIFSAIQQYFITGFGSLRDLPGLAWLPVPRWVTPPDALLNSGDKKSGKGSGLPSPARPDRSSLASNATASPPAGPLGRMYQLINKRVEEVERRRTHGATDQTGATTDAQTDGDQGDKSEAGDDLPVRRSSRRARSRPRQPRTPD